MSAWRLFALAAALAAGIGAARAEDTPRHGLSPFDTLAYPADFTHFSYADPAAPKGGTLTVTGVTGLLTFDSLNPFILKGTPAEGLVLNSSDTGGSLVFDSLMTRAGDESDAVYGLIAQSVTLSPDRRHAVFTLRPQARFHDGSPLTAEDVVFTVNALKDKGHPDYRFPLKDVSVKALAPDKVAFDFSGDSVRDLALFVAQIPIASKAYYATHDFAATSLDPPLASGPYEVTRVNPGRDITYRRVADYWAKDLPVNAGRWNFDTITYQFYRDRTVAFQGFTAHTYDLREEFTAKTWATEYNFPAVRQGRVKLLTLPDQSPSGVQGYFLNTRRPLLADIALREAIGLAFDFEWLNKNLFYGAYRRTVSYFQNSDMEAQGPPSTEELALLAPFHDRLPARVFGPALVPPVTDGSGQNRANIRAAAALLQGAGYTLQGGKLMSPAGKPVALEFLSDEPRMADIAGSTVQGLKALGIEAAVRLVDSAQYQDRLKSYDFDIVVQRYALRQTPGVELRQYYGSVAAKTDGSQNLSGIADPVADALIEDIIQAKSRAALVTAAHALDRVLRAGFYWVPHWYKGVHTIAYWDKFGRPATPPAYQRGILDTWWVDPQKEKALGR